MKVKLHDTQSSSLYARWLFILTFHYYQLQHTQELGQLIFNRTNFSSETYLKRQCRLHSIRRWPHRKIQVLLTQKRQMELQCPYVHANMLERWQKKIEELGARIKHLREFGFDKELYIPRRMRLWKCRGTQKEPELYRGGKVALQENKISNEEHCYNSDYSQTPLGFHLKLDIGSLMNDPLIKILF